MSPVFAIIKSPAVYGKPYYKVLDVITDLWLADQQGMTRYHTQAKCFFTEDEAFHHINYLKQKAI